MSARFRGREAELDLIRKALDPQDTPTQLKSFALYGMGGVGKTQLAHGLCSEQQGTFRHNTLDTC